MYSLSIVTVLNNNIHLPAGDEAVADQVGGADKQSVGRVWILGKWIKLGSESVFIRI